MTPHRPAPSGRAATLLAASLLVLVRGGDARPAPLGWSAPPTGVATSDSLRVFSLESLGEGVWAAVVLPRPDAYAFANSLVVVGDDGVLVVDTQQSPAAAEALIAEIRSRTGRPVRWVVNTHWHGDHVYGNVAYRDAFPGVRFLAHPGTVAGMRGPGVEMRAAELEELPGTIADRTTWLETGRLPDGRELDDRLRADVEYSLRLRTAYLDQLRTLDIVEPEGALAERTELDLGGRVVELIPLGPAHTAGDLAVLVPDAGVLAVGDLLEEAAPWIDGAASLAGWADALDSIAAEDVPVLLPAHGDVQRDGRLLAAERGLFSELVGEARRAVSEGWSDDEIAARLGLEAHRPFLRGLGMDDAAVDAWVAEARTSAVAAERQRRR